MIINKININNIISITSRVNLAGEHMKELDLEFYIDLKNTEDYDTCDRLVIQLESLRKCNYENFNNGVVILDEVNSLLSHFRSPTMHKYRKDNYLYLCELIKNAKYVISLDADLSDWNITFLQNIEENANNYIIYYNTVQNKIGIPAIIYKSAQIMLDIMEKQIIANQPFIATFDSLTKMNQVIDYLSKFGNKKEWFIYSSEVDYKLIDTKDWIDKFVFFTPTIIYGIDYPYKKVDVFAFVYKNHMNPLQIFQMISRGRYQNKVHVYSNQRESVLKYKCVEDVIKETELYEKNFGALLPLYKNYIDIDETPYRTMFYNFQYMDSVLKTNIKGYLIDMLIDKGYDIYYEDTFKQYELVKPQVTIKTIKERIIDLLSLNKNDLSELEKKLVSDDKALEKHFNLRLLLNNKIDDKLVESISQNLFLETFKNKYTKIKICQELMNLLNIFDLQSLNKNVSKNFTSNINNDWLKDNFNTIKKTFDIRGTKYNAFTYHNIYMLLMTIFKSLFDNNLFKRKTVKNNLSQYIYYELNQEILIEHQKIIKKMNDLDFI